jgi:GTP-binding protein
MEVLFLGSTNSGKSSLINAIKGEYVAKVAKKLTKTQDFLRYPIGSHPDSKYVLVDSPGFGYVRAPLRVKKKFRKMIFKKVADTATLLKIYFLVNGNIGLKATDVDMLDQLDNFRKPIQIVLTKIDKIDHKEGLMRILAKTSLETSKYKSVLPTIHFTSVKDNFGIKELKANIALTFLDDDYDV